MVVKIQMISSPWIHFNLQNTNLASKNPIGKVPNHRLPFRKYVIEKDSIVKGHIINPQSLTALLHLISNFLQVIRKRKNKKRYKTPF